MPQPGKLAVHSDTENKKQFLVVVQSSEGDSSTVLLGKGFSSPVATVKTSTLSPLVAWAPAQLNQLIEQHTNPNQERSRPASTVLMRGQQSVANDNATHDTVVPEFTSSSTVSLLQRTVTAPFDSVTAWVCAPMTLVVVLIAVVNGILRTVENSGLQLPITSCLRPTIEFLHVVALLTAIRAGDSQMEGAVIKARGRKFWRWLGVMILVVCTAIHALYRDHVLPLKRGEQLGVVATSAVAVFPFVPPVDDACLYAVASISVLRLVSRCVATE